MIWPSNQRERICSGDDNISFLYLIGLRIGHIDGDLATTDRCGSFFYEEVWADRIIRVDRLIVAIRRHTKRNDKNRSENRENTQENIFLHGW